MTFSLNFAFNSRITRSGAHEQNINAAFTKHDSLYGTRSFYEKSCHTAHI